MGIKGVMIKNNYLVLLFLCFCAKCLFAQNRFLCNNHDYQHDQNNKNMIKRNLRVISDHSYSGRYLNIMYYSDEYTDTDVLLPDSLHGPFVITRVIEKRHNYILKRNKLTKQILYMLDVVNITQEQSPAFICVIVPTEKLQKSKIESGDTLKTTIYPLFWKDKFIDNQGDTTYTSLPSLKTPHSFVFRDIWIENLHTSYRNYFFVRQFSNFPSIIAKRNHFNTVSSIPNRKKTKLSCFTKKQNNDR